MSVPLSAALAPSTLQVPALADAYRTCLRLCRAHYENFPVASRLLPAALQGPVAAVYAFARVADDFADEPGWAPAQRLELLSDWRARLRACRTGHDRHPVFWAVADVLERFALPLDPFERLITAFEMDVKQNRFERFEDLLFYCRHSADPVGELVLRLFGEWTEKRGKASDAICTALQLANFWQDVIVDAKKDRLYVPLEDCRKFGLAPEEVMFGPNLALGRPLILFQAERTWARFREGRFLCDDVSPRLGRELRLVWLGGTRILEKIGAQGGDVWSRRPRLRPWDWLSFLPRWLFWRREVP